MAPSMIWFEENYVEERSVEGEIGAHVGEEVVTSWACTQCSTFMIHFTSQIVQRVKAGVDLQHRAREVVV